ncbi:MAG TPA: ComEC/Rec2 family competence protein [Candidatus Paceibacterota bacterium]|nr:ComEC/Rec2 family competence protein [Candidatus Paceibacterota bacterium]
MDYFYISIGAFAVGVAVRSLIVFGWPAVAFGIVLAAIFFLFCLVRREKLFAVLALVLVCASLGAARTELAPHVIPSEFVSLLDANVSLTGTVVEDPDVRELNQHVTILIASSTESTKILAYASLYPTFEYGEKVRVSGTLESPEPFATDGGRTFAYDKYLAKDGIFSVITRAYIEPVAPPTGFATRILGALYIAKHAFVEGLDAALPEPAASLAEGLLTGGKQGLGAALITAFTIAGLLQIVVLSGYNVMVVAEGVLKALSFLPRRAALSIAAVVIILFIVTAGSGSSAIRAGVMACLALYARASGRTYSALRALMAALFVMLLWNPYYLVFDPGFELSAVATLGLILGVPMIEPYLLRVKSALLREIIATTLAAQLFVLPLLLYQTGNLSFVAVPANILVSLLVPAAMLASAIAGVVGLVAPFIAPVFGVPAYVLLSVIIGVAQISAAMPFANVTLPAFPFLLALLMYAGLAYALALSKRSSQTVQLRLSKNASM